jgi:hypothetical protein
MGHYQQWNMKIDEVIEITHSNIIDILKENKGKIILSRLVALLNNKTKNIKFHSKKKLNCLSKYMKHNYGGILKFLDDYSSYGIKRTNNDIEVILLDLNDDDFFIIENENEWILL